MSRSLSSLTLPYKEITMIALFRAVIERVKALFITAAALDLEADFVARHAERQAELLRQADRYA